MIKKYAVTWRRLNHDDRNRIARPHIYTASMLAEHDRQKLLRAFWKPMGPTGISDIDFREAVLYLIEQPLARWEPNRWQPDGWLVSPDLWLSVPILNAGLCRLSLAPLPQEKLQPNAQTHPSQIQLFMRDAQGQLIAEHTVAKVSSTLDLGEGFNCPKGWLTVKATEPTLINVLMDRLKLAPSTSTTWGYQTPESGLIYDLTHSSGEHIPLRLDFRAPSTLATPSAPTTARITTAPMSHAQITRLDDTGKALETLRWPLQMRPLTDSSRHERLRYPGEPLAKPVQHADSVFMNLPKETAAVRVQAPANIVIYAHTRPEQLPYRMSMSKDLPDSQDQHAEDFSSLTASNNGKRIAPDDSQIWFSLKPNQWKTLEEQNRSIMTVMQEMPPVPPERHLQGEYRYTSLTPASSYQRAGTALIAGQTDRNTQPSEHRYTQINTAWKLSLPLNQTPLPPSPELLYFREDISLFQFSIARSAETLHSGQRAGQRGVIRLPQRIIDSLLLNDGEEREKTQSAENVKLINTTSSSVNHLLQVSLPDAKIFANFAIPDAVDNPPYASTTHLKRTFYQSENGRITFRFEKDTDEYPLTLQWIDGNTHEKTFHVRITPLTEASGVAPSNMQDPSKVKLSSSYSITHRQVELGIQPGAKTVYLLSGGDQQQHGPFNAFIPLYEDLPTGSYELTISNDDITEDFFIAAFHLLVGQFNQTDGPFLVD